MVPCADNTLLNPHLSYTQFEHAIKQFEMQTRQHQPWSLVEYQISSRLAKVRRGVPTQLYLSRTEAVVEYPSTVASATVTSDLQMEHVPEINSDGDILPEDEESALEVDDSMLEDVEGDVPVLYFNAYKSSTSMCACQAQGKQQVYE
ncbi:hypothetical protein BGZ73_008413 [Actinomortierella ambigua]|nr:hypothetical protein BGZ73_008413 [Actinomortierella ambigua]